jgi:hypothetical protein
MTSKRRRKKSAQAQIGIFDLGAASKATADTFQTWIDHKLFDPRQMDQFTAATIYAQKNLEKLKETATIAGAPLEGLQRLANEAGSVRTQLDQLATTSMTPLCGTLRSIDFSEAA